MKQKLEKILLSLKGSVASYPFGPEALVFKVQGKMFALIGQSEAAAKITLKCAPADAEILVSEYESISQGYYMNKKHWITISLINEVPEETLIDLINHSYALVISKLTKKDKALLAEL